MAFYARFERLGRMKLARSGFDVTKSPVDGRQFRTHVQDGNVHSLASLASQAVFGGRYDPARKACTLAGAVGS
jgi:hypothetical protein